MKGGRTGQRELATEREIIYVNTSAMVADCMTKPVGPDQFALVPAMLGLAMNVVD